MEIAQLLTVAARVVPYVPPALGYAACDLLGTVVGPRLPAWSHILANLAVVLPNASQCEREAAARGVMIGLFKNYFDLFRFHTLTPTALEQTYVVEGLEHVQRAVAQGRGLLVVAPHCGNYTILFAALVRRINTRALLVVEQLADPRLHQIMNQVRRMPGIDVEPLSPTIGRTILRALRNNHAVMLGGDRALAENAVTVNFFGRPTPMPSGPATLALRTDAPLLTCFSNRLPDNRSWARFDPWLCIERSGTLQDDIRNATQKIAYIMQAYIRRDPSQWLVADLVWPTA